MSLYAVALRFPFTGTMGPSPNHEKQPQTIIPSPPNFTVSTMVYIYTLESDTAHPNIYIFLNCIILLFIFVCIVVCC